MNLKIEKEVWKEIIVKGLGYKVSNYGRIIGVSSGRILKTRLNEDGYVVVTMGKNSEGRVTKSVHRLVAKLFIDNYDNLPEVNHKDFDRENNFYENLEWVTHVDNIAYTVNNNRHSTANGKMKGDKNPNYGNNTLKLKYANDPELAKINSSRPREQNGRAKIIKLYDIHMNFIKEFKYIGACAEYLIKNGITKSKIDSIRASIRLSIINSVPYLNHYYQTN